MNTKNYIIIGLVVLGIGYAMSPARGDDVEINMDVLEDYRPPPMFEDLEPPPLTSPVVEEPPQAYIEVLESPAAPPWSFTPPLPQKKPAITVIDLEEEDKTLQGALAEPTARDVLNQISDGDSSVENLVVKNKHSSSVKTITPETFDIDDSKTISIDFLPGSIEMAEDLKPALMEEVLVKSTRAQNARIEIHAFASKASEGISDARRTSLARALAVREFLIANKIDSRRIDIRALGEETNSAHADRVDIIFMQ